MILDAHIIQLQIMLKSMNFWLEFCVKSLTTAALVVMIS